MQSVSARTLPSVSFCAVFDAAASERPDSRAFTFLTDGESAEHVLTNAEMVRRARAIATAMRAVASRGDRVLLLYPPGLEFIAAFFGCLCGGVIAIPAYPPSGAPRDRGSRNATARRLASIVRDAKPAIALTLARLVPFVTEHLADPSIHCIATDEIPDALAADYRDTDVDPHDPAWLQYTSGSTAEPKGVVLTHANLLHNSAAIQATFGHTHESVGCGWLPPYHDMGLVGGIIQPLYAGFPVVLMSPASFLQKPGRWMQQITRYRATSTGAPNFAYEFCARAPITDAERAAIDLSTWTVAFNGAEPIDPATIDRFTKAFEPCGFRRETFFPCYGMAEATLMITGGPRNRAPVVAPVPDAPDSRAVGCGHAAPDTMVRIVDPLTCLPRVDGEVGEVWVRGPGVAAGYWQQPDLSAQTFAARLDGDDQPYLRTGDLGFVRDGELFITGRIKDVIIVRGAKHYPQDLERTVGDSHAALRPASAAAFTVSTESGERLVILQELDRAARNEDPAPILAAIQTAVTEEHAIAVHDVLLLRPGQILKTPSGKVQRYACRDAYLAKQLDVIAEWHAAAPTEAVGASPATAEPMTVDSLEAWLTERFAAAIGQPPADIDPTEPFARYGLDSLKAVEFATAISAHVKQDVSVMLFWDYPTIASLAQYLANLTARAAESPSAT